VVSPSFTDALFEDSPLEAADLLARLPVAVYRTSPSGEILAANPAFAELLGAESLEQLKTVNAKSFYADPHRRDHMVDRVARGVIIGPEEIQLRRLDGQLIWVRVTSLGIHAHDGTVQYYEGALEDITARRHSEEQLARSNALLAALSRAQGRYITGQGDPFDELLTDLLSLTDSTAGVIARVLFADGGPVLEVQAIIGDQCDCEATEDEDPAPVLDSRRVTSLLDTVATAGARDRPDRPSQAADTTVHERFLVMPIVRSGEVIGVIGVEGRPQGYDDAIASYLEPLMSAIAGLMEARNTDEALAKAEEYRRIGDQRFRSVIEAANDTVLVYDAAGTITAANPAVWQVFGRAPQELVGRNILSMLPDDQAERHREVILGAREATAPIQVDAVHVSGIRKHTEMSIGATRSDDEPIFTAVIRDISERKSTERALLAAKHAAERASQAKDQFLAAMSHELRTPLNGVIGLSSILARSIHGPINDKQREYLTQIEASGRHLLALINDVLDLAKIEADRLEPEYESIHIGRIAEEAVGIIRESAVARRLTVELNCPADIPEVVADARRVKQVMVNLLSNAVKFTEPGGRIGLSCRSGERTVCVEVWDTGVGIPAEHLSDLFIPFQQVDSSLSRRSEGTGLGLALSQRLVEAQGGRMYVESEFGVGSRFGFELPLDRDELGTAAASSGDDPTVSAQTRLSATVLVVDDNDVNRMLLCDYFTAVGVSVIEAKDGDEAVALAIEQRPGAIVMDIQMPGRDGLSATRELKARPDTAAIPIVALTALAMPGDADRCLAAGCDEYLSKPCDPEVVLETVARAIRRT
jgi:two-component system, NtrC family, sensor kinase